MPTDQNTSVYLLCKGSVGTDPSIGTTGKRYDLEVKQSKLRFSLDAGDAGEGGKDELQTDASPLFTGEWVNLVAIRDTSEEKLKVYINGSLVEESGISKSQYGIGEHSALILGNIGEIELSTGAFTPAPYYGKMDEVKVFNYALSPEEILTMYLGGAYAEKPYSPNFNKTTINGYTDTLRLKWKGGTNTTKYKVYFGKDSSNLALLKDSVDIS